MIAAVFALALSAADAPAPPAAYDKVFSGALISTYGDGRQARLWLTRDGAFEGEGRTRARNSGRWTLDGTKLCMRQSRPFPIPFRYCTPLPATGLDTPWAAKSPRGEPVTVRYVAGDRP